VRFGEERHVDRQTARAGAFNDDRALVLERRGRRLLRRDTPGRNENDRHGEADGYTHHEASFGVCCSTNFCSAIATSDREAARPTSDPTRYRPPRDPRSYRNALHVVI